MSDKQDIEEKIQEYTAFGVTGGIAVMVGVFIHQLIIRPAFWLTLFHRFFGN